MVFLRLAGYLLWIPGGLAIIAAVIMPVVGSGLSRRGRVAAAGPRLSCAKVRARAGRRGASTPVHVHGVSAAGPAGLLSGRLSGSECVWYRDRVLRRFLVTQIRYVNDEWTEVDELVEEQIWAWESGPFAVSDQTGSVLVAPALLEHTLNVHGHPVQRGAVDEARDDGADPEGYRSGALIDLLARDLVPAGLFERFAEPGARTSGYRVQEDILRPGLPFYVFAMPGDLDGEPIMATPVEDVWAISAEPMPAALGRGGSRARSWAIRFGLAGVALFAASALLLQHADLG